MKESYFLGSSGKEGFFSCFSQISPKIDGQYTYIIKGGPGTGKSTLMRRIADELERRDLACERIYCSSDPDSLDGIIIPSLRVSIADGTAPHTLDPEYPGAAGEIINLGECWNKQMLYENRKKIIELTDKNKDCHRRSRRFIESAFSIFGDGEKSAVKALTRKSLCVTLHALQGDFSKSLRAESGLKKSECSTQLHRRAIIS